MATRNYYSLADSWLKVVHNSGGRMTFLEIGHKIGKSTKVGLRSLVESGKLAVDEEGYYITPVGYDRLNELAVARVMEG